MTKQDPLPGEEPKPKAMIKRALVGVPFCGDVR